MKKEAVAAGSGRTKQGAAPQGTAGDSKSVVISHKASAVPSKPLAPQTRQWVWLLVGLGIIAILVITALIIGLVFLTKSSGSVAPAVCQSRGGEKVPEDCIIPSSSCNQQCEYYSYKWPFKNDSIISGSFTTTSHVCQKSNVKGRCNTEGRCVTDDTSTNMQVSQSKGANWTDLCQPNPCWDKTSEDTIDTWTGKGVVNLAKCKALDQDWNEALKYCRPNASAVLSVQHRRCDSGKRCDQRPFRVWVCANCPGPVQPFTSCQDQSNGAMCTDGYCLGDVCVRADDRIDPNKPSEC